MYRFDKLLYKNKTAGKKYGDEENSNIVFLKGIKN